MDQSADLLKLAAAKSAVELVKDGMITGVPRASARDWQYTDPPRDWRVQQGLRLIGRPAKEFDELFEPSPDPERPSDQIGARANTCR